MSGNCEPSRKHQFLKQVGGRIQHKQSRQQAKALVSVGGRKRRSRRRPEDAAHKRRRRQRQSREQRREIWQFIYSIRTYQTHISMRLVLLLVAIFVAHTSETGGQQAPRTAAGGQHNPKDYFHHYFAPHPPPAARSPPPQPPPPPGSDTSRSTSQQPLYTSQAEHRRPTHSIHNSSSFRVPKQARVEGALGASESDQQQNAWIPMPYAARNRAATTTRTKPQVRENAPTTARRRRPAGTRLAASEQNSSSSAALLDYPLAAAAAAAASPPSRQQHISRPLRPAANHRPPRLRPSNHPRNRTRGPAPTGGARQGGRGHEIQVAQGSHVHHRQHNNYPPPLHTSIHHYHQHHHHHWPPPQLHRTPRYQHTTSGGGGELGPLGNELADGGGGGGPSLEPSKMYKRVLLCDKTLVSLDYIRDLDAEPRPYGTRGAHKLANLASYHLNDHEINEISDNFLDLDGNFDSSLSRSSVAAASAALANSTSSTTASRAPISRAGPPGNATMTNREQPSAFPVGPLERLAANETSAATEISVDLTEHEHEHEHGAGEHADSGTERRRGHAALSYRESLLNDQDPLVRCDMWDLEKGLKSRKPPAHILRMAVRADFDTVRDAINRCRQLSERTLPPEDEYRGDGLELMSTEDLVSLFSMKRGLMPGTKWCGLGDQAETYNDLGPKHRIDICCRAHDHCPIRSKPFRNDYGVLNIGLYTKSHCDCDADFYRCLREVRSRTADMLGNLYFNVMKLQCMREERLKVCREMKPLALGFERCVRYEDSPVATVFKFTTPPVAY